MEKSHKKIIVLSIFLVIGYIWSLDMPLALQVPLRQQPYNFSNFQYNFLYFATFGAIFFSDMPLGMLLDKFPIKKTVIIISLVSLLSETGILLTFYFQFPGYKIFLYIFRGIFGITGEALFTVQALLITLYGGKYYDRLLGVGVCAPFLFDSINNILTPFIFDLTHSMELVWGIGITVCLLTFGCGIMISHLVLKQEEMSKEIKDSIKQDKKEQEEQEVELNFKGLKEMPKQFWVLIVGVFFTEYVLGCYVDNLNDSIVKRFKISYVNAGYLMFIPFGFASIISFVLGLIIEKKPKLRRIFITSSTIVYSIGLLIIYFLPNIKQDDHPTSIHYIVIALQFLTVSYLYAILYGVLSSAIVYVVSKKYLGIAWGVIGSTIGFSQATSPLLIAWILQTENNLAEGYQKLTLFIFFASLLAIISSLWLLLGRFEAIDQTSYKKNKSKDLEQSLLQFQQDSSQIIINNQQVKSNQTSKDDKLQTQ